MILKKYAMLELFDKLNKKLVEMAEKYKKPSVYDPMTREVSKAAAVFKDTGEDPDFENWNIDQIELYDLTKNLMLLKENKARM